MTMLDTKAFSMHFDVITLFPSMFSGPLNESILKKAREKEIIKINLHNLRDFANNPHSTVDDVSYGGGPGMVIKPEPLFEAVENIKGSESAHVVYLTPRGKVFNQETARKLTRKNKVILVCGHYEEVDQRFVDNMVDEEISIGDYVLTGGEVAAMVVIDSVARLLPGVIGDPESHEKDSFSEGILDHSHYTRPENYRGLSVPKVLLSGNHEQIRLWRVKSALSETLEKRPDLLDERLDSEKELILSELREKSSSSRKFYVALIHYPVYNKNESIVATSITNLDIHDISRSCKTFGAVSYYLVTPLKSQIEMANRIIGHWQEGHGAKYNKDRLNALKQTVCVESIDDVREEIRQESKEEPFVIFTSAKHFENSVSFDQVLPALGKSGRPILILFGTGWGMSESIRKDADLVLEPIAGSGGYNHLSVRSAVAIILDRLKEKRVI